MACCAILRISAIDVVRASCCKAMAVKKDNVYYRQLLRMVGLPTFAEMAKKDSVSTTRQVFKLKPEFFVDNQTSTGRPRRTVSQVERFGIDGSLQNCNHSERVKKLGLPVSLGKDVPSSGV